MSANTRQGTTIGGPTDGLPMPQRLHAIIALGFGTALLVMDNTIATVALPTIARDLEIAPSLSVSVVTIYQMVLLMAVLPLSSLGDLIGNKRLYQSGQLLFLVASLLCAFVNSLPFLLFVRAAQALGVAAALAVSVGLLRHIYPAKHLGRGLALNSIIIASAAAAAPSLGGLLLTYGSWRWVFLAAAPLALISLALGKSLPSPAPSRTDYDFTGALLCAVTFGALIGALEGVAQDWSPAISSALFITGTIFGVYMVRRELNSRRPILPVDLLARPAFSVGVAAALLSFFASMSFNLSLPFRLNQAYSLSPAEIGILMGVSPVIMMCTAPLAGYLTGKAPKGLLTTIGLLLTAAGFGLMSILPPEFPGYLHLALPLVLTGMGSSFFQVPNSHLIMSSAPASRGAAAGAMISTTRLVGSTLGASALALLMTFGLGHSSAPALMSAACALLGAACSVSLLLPRRKELTHV